MKLIHTLLFLVRENYLEEDIHTATACLNSMKKNSYKTLIIYNQGFWTNEQIKDFLKDFQLDYIIIGDGENVGTVVGRQSCFDHIWKNYPDTRYISEIHLDMHFTYQWEDALVKYLDTQDEPMISCGIMDQYGTTPFLDREPTNVPEDPEKLNQCLEKIKCPIVVPGFTNPCIHNALILKEIGGYNAHFLVGKQAYEDDSMLLGYYYYYGTKADWKPKVNYNSVVYHAVAGQRLELGDDVSINYSGLVKQYGGMGLKHLSRLHTSPWHKEFFAVRYRYL